MRFLKNCFENGPIQTPYESPLGRFILIASDIGLRALALPAHYRDQNFASLAANLRCGKNEVTAAAADELDEYFAGHRQQFSVPLDSRGSAFDQRCWEALRDIPYGTTCSYSDQARAIRRPNAVRAVGGANRRNPLPIIVPCHRVVGKDGGLGGYAGGVEMKRWLLDHEQSVLRDYMGPHAPI